MDAAPLASSVVDALIDASVAGAFAAAVAWTICTHARLGPRWQALVWWAVSLKLLLVLAGAPSIPVPVLPGAPPPTATLPTDATADGTLSSTPYGAAAALAPSPAAPDGGTMPSTAGIIATRVLASVWLLGVAVGLVNLGLSHRRLRRLRRRAGPADEATVRIVEHVAARAGVRRLPETFVSADIRAPQTIGALRPLILLPADAHERWSDDELRMALSHELAHVRRRDLLWGWVPVLAESLFFFHPLARLAAREYLVAREAACDAEAIEAAQAEPEKYARLLVHLGIQRSGGALAAGGASGSRSILKRRLEMLVPAPRHLSRPGRVALAGLAALALLPLELGARQTEAPRAVTAAPATPPQAARPVVPAEPSQPARPVIAAPAAPAVPPRPARPVSRAVQQAPAPAAPSASVPTPAPRRVERAQRSEAALERETLRRELEAARREAAERGREAGDAAREMRALERALQETRAQAEQSAEEPPEQGRQMRPEQQAQMRAELEAAAGELEAARGALRAQGAPDARSAQERSRALEEVARQLEALRARPAPASALPEGSIQVLREQLGVIATQQESLLDQQRALAQQQQALADAQRRLAEQLARMQEALDSAR